MENPAHKLFFEGCGYIHMSEMPQVLATTCQNVGLFDGIILML